MKGDTPKTGDKLNYIKAYKDLYQPKIAPSLIDVPEIGFLMVNGKGNPNQEDGEYAKAMGLLYTFAFTIKMSKMSKTSPPLPGYFEYVMPPLEGLWWMEDKPDINFLDKDKFIWTSMIRVPEFIDDSAFEYIKTQVSKKKPELDISKIRFEKFCEGLCVQIMHIGPYDDEPASVIKMKAFINQNGLIDDLGGINADGTVRRHHEIYLGDPRKTAPEKRRTIIRHPVR